MLKHRYVVKAENVSGAQSAAIEEKLNKWARGDDPVCVLSLTEGQNLYFDVVEFGEETAVVDEPWPRVRDLSQDIQRAFSKWLVGKTRPTLKGVEPDEQDAYFPWDYETWEREQL